MKWIAKALRHHNSLQVVIAKRLTKEMKWGYNTHFIVQKLDDKRVVIESIDDWAEKKKGDDCNEKPTQTETNAPVR